MAMLIVIEANQAFLSQRTFSGIQGKCLDYMQPEQSIQVWNGRLKISERFISRIWNP